MTGKREGVDTVRKVEQSTRNVKDEGLLFLPFCRGIKEKCVNLKRIGTS